MSSELRKLTAELRRMQRYVYAIDPVGKEHRIVQARKRRDGTLTGLCLATGHWIIIRRWEVR